MKCLVSGATGFIGRELCHQLRVQGDVVVGLSNHGECLADGAATLAVDLSVNDPGAELLQGVDTVFHLAGIAHQNASDGAYQSLNYDATLRLARLASREGVGCFVFVSSVKAMGSPPGAEPRGEEDCVAPADAYGRSKWQAECALREEFLGSDMSIVILRPALVYGPGARGNLQLLAAGVRRGLPRPPEGGRRSMIALADLVALLCEVGASPPTGVHTWIVSGAASYSTREIYDLLRAATGKGPGVAWLPRWGWRVVASLLDMVTRSGGDSTYNKMFGTELYRNARVVAARNWRPRVGLEDVIGQMMDVSGAQE